MPPAPSLPVSTADVAVLSAASAGRADALEAALAAGGSPTALDWSGDSALVMAARGSHSACVNLLLRAGVDPAQQQGQRGETAVHVAVQRGDTTLLDAMLTGSDDLSAKTDVGLTAFALACRHGRPCALRALLRRQHELLDAAAAAAAEARDAAAARLAAGRPLVSAMFAAVAAGAASCLQLLVCDPLARAAYSAQFPPGGAAPPLGSAQQARQGSAQQDELSFLLEADLVQTCGRAAGFLQTGELLLGEPLHVAAALDQLGY